MKPADRPTLFAAPLLAYDARRLVRAARALLPFYALFSVGVPLLGWVVRLLDPRAATSSLPPQAAALAQMTQLLLVGGFVVLAAIALMQGVYYLLPYLRSAVFEQVLVTGLTRAELTRTLWLATFGRCCLWAGAIGVTCAATLVATLPREVGAPLALRLLYWSPAGVAVLAVAASAVVRLAFADRSVAQLLWKGMWRLAVVYPFLFAYLSLLFVVVTFTLMAPLAAFGMFALEALLVPPTTLMFGVQLFVLGLALCYCVQIVAFVVRYNLEHAEAHCVPADWLRGRGTRI